MALARPMPPLWQALMPALHGPVRPLVNLPLLHRLSQPFRLLPTTFAGFPLPSIALPAIPSLADIWDGLLNAVPKKKTSHMKKRHRFMAGKGIKDLINLNKCSACGRVKRAHLLCPHCVYAIKTKLFGAKDWLAGGLTDKMHKQRKRDSIIEKRRSRTGKPVLEPSLENGKLGKQAKW